MDGGTSDVELLLASVRQEIAALEADQRLKEPDDGNRGRALYHHIRDLLGAAEHQLTKKPEEGAPDHAEESFDRVLRTLLQTLRQAHAAIPWLVATRDPQVNPGTLYLAEECAEILVGSDIDLVVVADPEYMYSAQSWPFGRVVEMVSGFTPTARSRPVILRYPLSDDNRLLLHSIFSHELGHPAAQERGLVETILAALESRNEFQVGLQTTAAEVFPGATGATPAQMLRGWLGNWFEETICDHLAIELTGPAYLWAFAGFVMPLSYDSPSCTHPTNTVRVRLMLEHLAARGWEEYLRKRTPDLLRWLQDVSASAEGRMDPPFTFFRDQLLEHRKLIQGVVERVVGDGRLEPVKTVAESDAAEALLDDLILPVGESPRLQPRSILLGGWQRALATYGDRPEGVVASLADRPLQDLVGKAIELAVVSRCWEEGA